MGAGGALVVTRFSARTTRGCASVGVSLQGKAETSFVPHCLEPGLAFIGGLVLVIGGAVLVLWGLWAMVRSWGQRERRRAHPDVLPPLRPTDRSPGFFSPGGTAAISPPPGWYAVPPDYQPMWWNGTAWGTAPTLPPVQDPAAEGS